MLTFILLALWTPGTAPTPLPLERFTGEQADEVWAGGQKKMLVLFNETSTADLGRDALLYDLQTDRFKVFFVFSGQRTALSSNPAVNNFLPKDRLLFIREHLVSEPEYRVYDEANRLLYQSSRPVPEKELYEWVFASLRIEDKARVTIGKDGVIFQKGENDCAVAATTMLLERHGHRISFDSVWQVLENDGKKVSLLSVKEFLTSEGYRASAWKTDVNGLRKQRLPVLVYLDEHLVVLSRIMEKGVVILDPKKGRQLINRGFFEMIWGGIYMRIDGRS
ncbi:MAG: cysteine peptidase family C39 domain-containing protein [Acidobacteriota bacterium]|nr:cysteine peptidase family C39 domain-containing protein [Acidobacteriota bacterium]